jgi:hypothetical protein
VLTVGDAERGESGGHCAALFADRKFEIELVRIEHPLIRAAAEAADDRARDLLGIDCGDKLAALDSPSHGFTDAVAQVAVQRGHAIPKRRQRGE